MSSYVFVLASSQDARREGRFCAPAGENALRKLLAECDTLVVVGGHNSYNTLQLVAAGRRVITRVDELRDEWFSGAENVGVTAGTSTLKETVAAKMRATRRVEICRFAPFHRTP